LKAHFDLELTGIRRKAQMPLMQAVFGLTMMDPIRFIAFHPISKYPKQVTKTVLFICTGNFYRSRFAEAVFNYHASSLSLPWKAISRGLAIHWATGPLSPFTAGALAVRRIPLHHTGRDRTQLTEDDLKSADLRILMDRAEHFAMMMEQFPDWTAQVEYWDVPDLPINQPEVALPAIEGKVLELLDRLSQ
jgi:protein-tyrosine phosphatase